jgi:hypothetical protein
MTDTEVIHAPHARPEVSLFGFTVSELDALEHVAEIMATATDTIPPQYRGKKGNCFMVAMNSARWRLDPFEVAGKTHFINGNIGYEAQLVTAILNTSGALTGNVNVEWFGPWEKIIGRFVEKESRTKKNEHGEATKYRTPAWSIDDEEGLGVRVFATLRGETKPRELEIAMKQARVRNSTLWADDPKQQIAYLAQKRWGRLHAPQVMLGYRTPDELHGRDDEGERDMGRVDEVAPAVLPAANRTESVKQRLRRAAPARATAPNIEAVLAAIDAATNAEQLAAAGEQASALANDADKARAREAYAAKLQASRTASKPATAPAAATEPADPATGEVVMTFAEVMDLLENAKDSDELSLAADHIRYVEHAEYREELTECYQARAAKFDEGAAQ